MGGTFIDDAAIFGANYLYLVLLFAALAWFVIQPRSDQIDMAIWGLVALPTMYLLLILAGIVYFDPRPFVAENFTPLITHAPDNGFPSDHTLLCSATSSIVFCLDKRMSSVLWLLTALVGASRVYTGLHHPLDILTSVIIAFTVTYVVWKFAMPSLKLTGGYQSLRRTFERP